MKNEPCSYVAVFIIGRRVRSDFFVYKLGRKDDFFGCIGALSMTVVCEALVSNYN